MPKLVHDAHWLQISSSSVVALLNDPQVVQRPSILALAYLIDKCVAQARSSLKCRIHLIPLASHAMEGPTCHQAQPLPGSTLVKAQGWTLIDFSMCDGGGSSAFRCNTFKSDTCLPCRCDQQPESKLILGRQPRSRSQPGVAGHDLL